MIVKIQRHGWLARYLIAGAAGLAVMHVVAVTAAGPGQPPADSGSRRQGDNGMGQGRSSGSGNLSERLDRSGGVIAPPSDADAGMEVKPPPEGSSPMPVIPPPGSPGGAPNVRPK
jgi:hypothetical protein